MERAVHHHHHPHHQLVLIAWILLTLSIPPLSLSLSLFLSLPFRPNWSLFLASPQDASQCPHIADKLLVFTGHQATMWRRVESLSPLVLKQCSTCLVWMVCEIGGKKPYSCCFVRCCFLDLFKTAWIIPVFPPSFFTKKSSAIIQQHWHDCNLEEFLFYSIRIIRLPYH